MLVLECGSPRETGSGRSLSAETLFTLNITTVALIETLFLNKEMEVSHFYGEYDANSSALASIRSGIEWIQPLIYPIEWEDPTYGIHVGYSNGYYHCGLNLKVYPESGSLFSFGLSFINKPTPPKTKWGDYRDITVAPMDYSDC